MLDRHAYGTALERWDPAEPLVDSHSQRVLIAGWRWHTVELLRCHVRGRAGGTLRMMDGHTVYSVILNRRGEAKVTAVMLWHALANNILQADRMLRSHRITTA